MGKPPADLDLIAEPFMDNPLIMIAPRTIRLRGRKIRLAELEGEDFVVREPGSGTRVAMERFFAEQGFVHQKGMELMGNEAVKQGVEAGFRACGCFNPHGRAGVNAKPASTSTCSRTTHHAALVRGTPSREKAFRDRAIVSRFCSSRRRRRALGELGS